MNRPTGPERVDVALDKLDDVLLELRRERDERVRRAKALIAKGCPPRVALALVLLVLVACGGTNMIGIGDDAGGDSDTPIGVSLDAARDVATIDATDAVSPIDAGTDVIADAGIADAAPDVASLPLCCPVVSAWYQCGPIWTTLCADGGWQQCDVGGCAAGEMCGDNNNPNQCGSVCRNHGSTPSEDYVAACQANAATLGFVSHWGVEYQPTVCMQPWDQDGGAFVLRTGGAMGCGYVYITAWSKWVECCP